MLAMWIESREADPKKENQYRKEAIKKFHLEAKEKGFNKKIGKDKYKNENGDIFELRVLAPYTTRIKFV